jgi:anhydro-N-acetylmuramic acid kinase
MKVIGLISGTSTDGIDAALVDISGKGLESQIKLLTFETYPYPESLKQRLLEMSAGNSPVSELCHLNFYLGELFARAASQVVKKAHVSMGEVELIGSHGQTVMHHTQPVRERGIKVRSTLQIGEPAVIAERTGITTVADFRPRDIAAGGEGAPLTPYLHFILFQDQSKSRLVVNIGGISNVTYLRAGKGPKDLLAFDSGPGNMLIDGMVQRWSRGRQQMDKGGKLAALGKVQPKLFRDLMKHPFLRKRPPKSTGREAFGRILVEQVFKLSKRYRIRKKEDVLATVTAFTAHSIAYSCKRYILPKGPLDQVIVGGGGTQNPTLMKMLREALAPLEVLIFEDFHFESRAIEAMAFALMAYQNIMAEHNNMPAATGASHPVIMGKILPGRNWPYDLGHNVIEKLWKI